MLAFDHLGRLTDKTGSLFMRFTQNYNPKLPPIKKGEAYYLTSSKEWHHVPWDRATIKPPVSANILKSESDTGDSYQIFVDRWGRAFLPDPNTGLPTEAPLFKAVPLEDNQRKVATEQVRALYVKLKDVERRKAVLLSREREGGMIPTDVYAYPDPRSGYRTEEKWASNIVHAESEVSLHRNSGEQLQRYLYVNEEGMALNPKNLKKLLCGVPELICKNALIERMRGMDGVYPPPCDADGVSGEDVYRSILLDDRVPNSAGPILRDGEGKVLDYADFEDLKRQLNNAPTVIQWSEQGLFALDAYGRVVQCEEGEQPGSLQVEVVSSPESWAAIE